MGNCGSVKKRNHHLNDKKISDSSDASSRLKNGGNNNERRKSIRMQEFDRVSNMTILDGNLLVFLK